MMEDIKIEVLKQGDAQKACELLKENLAKFHDSEQVLAATFRRLSSLHKIYSEEGNVFLVAKDPNAELAIIACVGLGPFHGLPLAEGVGEIRDMVVDGKYRGKGLGSRLLHRGISEAKRIGYKQLYLETSQQMEHAQKLFLRTGFRPVTEKRAAANIDPIKQGGAIPCYFLLENLQESPLKN